MVEGFFKQKDISLSPWPCSNAFHPGEVSWKCYDLFGGVLCLRKGWEMIESAALEL